MRDLLRAKPRHPCVSSKIYLRRCWTGCDKINERKLHLIRHVSQKSAQIRSNAVQIQSFSEFCMVIVLSHKRNALRTVGSVYSFYALQFSRKNYVFRLHSSHHASQPKIEFVGTRAAER